MRKNIKTDMRKRARVAAGLLNLLRDDIDQLRVDTDDFDLICLEESIKDTKTTLQMLNDNVTEIEYLLYLFRNENGEQIQTLA